MHISLSLASPLHDDSKFSKLRGSLEVESTLFGMSHVWRDALMVYIDTRTKSKDQERKLSCKHEFQISYFR